MDVNKKGSSEPESYDESVSFVGNGTGAPTKLFGKGVALSRTGVGVIKLTFTDPPGNLTDWGFGFKATTMSQLKGYSVVLGDFDATGKIISLSIFDSSFAAADLTSSQKLSLRLAFKRADSAI